MQKMKESPEGFTIIKQGVGYHSAMPGNVPNFSYSYDWSQPNDASRGGFAGSRGLLTEQGLDHVVRCVEAMKAVTGDAIGLALDCGPGWTIPDAIRLGRAVEPYNIMWIEDILTGDYVPWVNASAYREVTRHHHPRPYGRADLLAPPFQGAFREAGGARGRPRPGGRRWSRRTEVGGGVRRPARDLDGACTAPWTA
jgi:hypothetical protein